MDLGDAADGTPKQRRVAAHNIARLAYNWLRHADREDEPHEVEIDWQDAAGDVIARAGINQFRVTKQWPQRWQEVAIALHWSP